MVLAIRAAEKEEVTACRIRRQKDMSTNWGIGFVEPERCEQSEEAYLYRALSIWTSKGDDDGGNLIAEGIATVAGQLKIVTAVCFGLRIPLAPGRTTMGDHGGSMQV